MMASCEDHEYSRRDRRPMKVGSILTTEANNNSMMITKREGYCSDQGASTV